MRLILKKDWDVPVYPPTIDADSKGHFVGRGAELNQLTNEISRRDSGSILITGYRGVGKTSLVYEAIRRVQAQDGKLVPVMISASQLQAEATETSADAKRLIIESIIRRLYATTQDDKRLSDDVHGQVEKLYRKAVAATALISDEARTEAASSNEIIQQHRTTVSSRDVATFASFWVTALLLALIPGWGDKPIARILSLVVALPLPLLIRWSFTRESSTTSAARVSRSAKEVYEFDGSIGNLEFDLERLHRALRQNGIKLVYVIDELDKLEPGEVTKLLKFFKNLFTLSEALFVFIADDTLYKPGWLDSNKGRDLSSRPIDYTYFTSRYLLARPLYSDLRKFIREIIDVADGPDSDIDVFTRSVCYSAANDFFDLRSAIVDKISGFENGHPVIAWSGVPHADHQLARFHKVFTTLFENKYLAHARSKWDENEALQKALFEHLGTIRGAVAGQSFSDPHQDDIRSSLIRDCNALLSRVGALKSESESTQVLRGLSVRLHQYQYSGSIPEEPPETVTALSEYEMHYVSAVDAYAEYVRAIKNGFLAADEDAEISAQDGDAEALQRLSPMWDHDVFSPIGKHAELTVSLKKTVPPPVIDRAVVEKGNLDVINATTSLLTNTLPVIVLKMIVELNPASRLQHHHLSQDTALFSADDELREVLAPKNPMCLHTPDHTKQIAILRSGSSEVRRSLGALRPLQGSHQVILIDDFGDVGRRHKSGMLFINTHTPTVLRDSLCDALLAAMVFLGRADATAAHSPQRRTATRAARTA